MIKIKQIESVEIKPPNWKQIAAIILSLAVGYCLIKFPYKTVDSAKEIVNIYQERNNN